MMMGVDNEELAASKMRTITETNIIHASFS